MDNWLILGLQLAVSVLAATLIFFEYVLPRLAQRSFESAVLPMLLIHTFRFTGFTLLVIGQSDPAIPQDELSQMAWGDYLSAVAALAAAYAVWRRSNLMMPLIWLFIAVTVVDVVNVTRLIIEIDFFNFYIGSVWPFLTWYLPWIAISLFYVVYRLFNRDPQPSSA